MTTLSKPTLIALSCVIALISAMLEATEAEEKPVVELEEHQQAQTASKFVKEYTHKSVNYMNENGI
jgi:hypothetical protein